MDLENLKHELSGLDLKALIDIQTYVDNLVDTLSPDNVSAEIYDSLRVQFSEKYPAHQLETFKLWRHLKPARQREFNKVCNKAIKYFIDLDCGFKRTPMLRKMVADLVANSPYFQGKLLFEDLIASFDNIEFLFDTEFPGYRKMPEALKLLASKFQ